MRSSGRTNLLVLPVVSGDSSVGSLRLHDLSIGGNQLGGHESKRSETLSDDVTKIDEGTINKCSGTNSLKQPLYSRDNISIVVLESHDEVSFTLDHLSDHLQNKY